MAALNALIHQHARLRIMASLVTLQPDEQVEFNYLRNLLELTYGNLGAHLRKLEDADLIRLRKTFISRKPKTFIEATLTGRHAFAEHVAALKDILEQ